MRTVSRYNSPLSRGDRAFARHELTEAQLMDRGLGFEPAHRLASWTHKDYGNYDPSVIQQYPLLFNNNWRNHWGIE